MIDGNEVANDTIYDKLGAERWELEYKIGANTEITDTKDDNQRTSIDNPIENL